MQKQEEGLKMVIKVESNCKPYFTEIVYNGVVWEVDCSVRYNWQDSGVEISYVYITPDPDKYILGKLLDILHAEVSKKIDSLLLTNKNS
jgi:hypothetical protein